MLRFPRFLTASKLPFRRIIYSFASMSAEDQPKSALEKLGVSDPKLVTPEQWRSVMSEQEFEVTRNADTEPRNTGEFNKKFDKGLYICKCCGTELFVSDSKFRTTCGWPAFGESVGKDKNVVRIPDHSYGMERTEVRCKVCDAHLGHVFEEDTAPTGERYCINSCSINFTPSKE